MQPSGLETLSASEAARRLAARDISAQQMVRACLERIAEREPVVGAWTVVDEQGALAQARELDRGPVRGLLHGLTLGVKDLFDTADLPTAYGSPIYAGGQPRADAAVVALCRHAGAVVLGKTVTTEFATFQPGPTRNPHNTGHTPGGSSSGSAAAVADFMVHLALGTQTAGSIIRPAAFCGIVGYKPGFGHITRAGVKSLSESLDTVGGFGRTVEDAALFMAALTGDQRLLRLELETAPRIGLCHTTEWDQADDDARAALEEAGRCLSAAGATVSVAVLPESFAGLQELQKDIMAFEAFQALSAERLQHPELLSPMLKALLAQGESIPYASHQRRLLEIEGFRAGMDEVFGRYDVLIAPGARGEAPLLADGTGDPVFCRAWTLLGLPCIQVPVRRGARGLPVGVQFVGRIGADHSLFQIASWGQKHLKRA